MEKQYVIISLDYKLKHIYPAQELVKEITEELKSKEIDSLVSNSINLNFDALRIEIKASNCEAVYECIRPILMKTNINTIATVRLQFGGAGAKFVDMDILMGAECEKVDSGTVERVTELLKRKLPKKHGFLLISYAKNGEDVALFTENGVPDPAELVRINEIVTASLMP